jgi:hypothetical protein
MLERKVNNHRNQGNLAIVSRARSERSVDAGQFVDLQAPVTSKCSRRRWSPLPHPSTKYELPTTRRSKAGTTGVRSGVHVRPWWSASATSGLCRRRARWANIMPLFFLTSNCYQFSVGSLRPVAVSSPDSVYSIGGAGCIVNPLCKPRGRPCFFEVSGTRHGW